MKEAELDDSTLSKQLEEKEASHKPKDRLDKEEEISIDKGIT